MQACYIYHVSNYQILTLLQGLRSIWAKSVFGSLLRRSIKKRRRNYDEKKLKMHVNYAFLLKKFTFPTFPACF